LVAALDGALPDHGNCEAINAVQKLTGPQVDRLFTILPEGSHCDYTLATAKMRLYFNSDAELEDLGLVKTRWPGSQPRGRILGSRGTVTA
jgi:hypothetical protein